MNLDQPLFYRVEDVARMLSISRSEAYSLIYKGEIPSIRIRSMIRVPATALKAMVEQTNRDGRDSETA
jgi:excisionase family DNA binding protein